MKAFLLTLEERTLGFTHGFIIDHTDLTETTADTAQAIDLMAVGKGQAVTRAGYVMTENFEDASDADFDDVELTLGDNSAATAIMTAQQINDNGTQIEAALNTGTKAYAAAATLRATFGSMTAKKLSDLDKGEIKIFLQVTDMAALGGA